MRQHIDTIPIWEAYKRDTECPLCDIELSNEEAYVESFLGASVMEPITRVEVNEKGFCRRHFSMMFDAKNRLGLALIADTYLRETIGRIEAEAGRADKRPSRRGGGADGPSDGSRSCVICERLGHTMERYRETILHLWRREPEFERALFASKGFCLPHFSEMSALARERLGADAASRLTDLQRTNLRRVERDLEWFTLKFDYRNQAAPWGESRDAVERAILKLRGKMRREA